MARYTSYRRVPRRRKVIPADGYFRKAKRFGKGVVKAAGYAAAAGGLGLAGVALYRHYPELMDKLKAMGYKGAGLLNAAYDYLSGKVADGSGIAQQKYQEHSARWNAYRDPRTRWNEVIDSLPRGGRFGDASQHNMGPHVPHGGLPRYSRDYDYDMYGPDEMWSPVGTPRGRFDTGASFSYSRRRQRSGEMAYELP